MIELYLDNRKVDMPTDFKINMTYQQIDLEKPEAKINNYSKTVKVPGTNNNNNIFGHIFRFDTNIQTSDSLVGVSFDPNKRIPFVVLNNGDLYERGYAQLDKIDVVDGNISYDLTLYGTIGDFFYNLKFTEDGADKTLYDMYYGLINLNGVKLDETSENNDILFEYNKDYVIKCWDVIINKAGDVIDYDAVNDNDIRKFICPIPCYQGFHENFKSDTVLVNTYGLDRDGVAVKNINKNDTSYSPYNNWSKISLDREVSNFEMNDIRSHYLPYGIRLQAIYDAIKNPKNNGGFEVDDSNITEIEKKYIYEGYIMQNPFQWDDINANNINTTLQPSWNNMDVNLGGRSIHSETLDLTKYINPNGVFYVTPRIRFNWDIGQLHTQAMIYGGWYKREEKILTSSFFKTKKANHYCGDSIQYFWAEALDANGNVVKRSDVFQYGDKSFDDNDNPYFLYNVVGQRTSGGVAMVFSGYNSGDTGNSRDAIKYFLNRNGLKLKESSLNNYEKSQFEGYYTNDDNLGVAMNRSHLSGGYKTSAGTHEFVGEEIKIDMKLNPNIKSVRIMTDSIVTQWTANNADEGITTVFWPYDNRMDWNSKQTTFTPGFCTFTSVIDQEISYTGSSYFDEDWVYRRGANTTWVDWDKISGMVSSKTQIFDGAVETIDERHTVNKFSLLQNTSSPYDYLISLGKIFNWKMELDPITNKVMLYSFKNYYTNNILNINDDIDFKNVQIRPTTSDAGNYKFSLELEESYASANWFKKNKYNYGEKTVSTDYQFADEPKNVFEDCVIKSAVPYLQRSVFFNDSDSTWPRPTLGKYVDVSMWHWFDKKEEDDKRFGKLRTYPNLVSQNVTDVTPRLCLFDKEYSPIDMSNTLVFFNVENTVDTQDRIFHLSDNIQATEQLCDNNCYIFINNDNTNVVVDIDNGITDKPIKYIEFIPCFNTHFEYNNIEYWGNMKAEPLETRVEGMNYENYTDIYDICWKNFITDLYNKNNKVVTVKCRFDDTPRNAMKKFYTFDNAVWVINKIIDYNIDDYFTKVEFIQVQNKNNYIGQRIGEGS